MIIYTAHDHAKLRAVMLEEGLFDFDVPEIDEDDHLPLGPREIVQKVEGWAMDDFSFATMSEVAILAVQRLIRLGKLSANRVKVSYRDRDGEDLVADLDIHGDMICLWPTDDLDCIFTAAFHLRFH